jgi:hypothetical protein
MDKTSVSTDVKGEMGYKRTVREEGEREDGI